MSGPLNGIRVIDLTTVIMGPSASQVLADLGADVIKVESSGGDTMRNIGPMRNPGMGPLFMQANRNKRSIMLDLKNPEDMKQLEGLIAGADVFLSNIRPRALARLGLAYENVQKLNASIIFCSCVGYGQEGPLAAEAVYDDLMQAASGVSGMFERVDGKPRYAPVNICDRVVGLNAAVAVQAALIHRQRSGEGQSVEVPMFETMADFVLSDHIGGLAFVPPLGPTGYLRLLSRERGPYATTDGYLAVVVYTDAHWRRFTAIIGRPEVLEDPRFHNMQSRTTHAEDVGRLLAGELAKRSSGEWLTLLREGDIPACRVNSVDELFDNEHLAAVGFFSEVDHPTEGRLRLPRSPLLFSRTPLEVRHLAPPLGYHNQELGIERHEPELSITSPNKA
jgi:crotonobetainyl-CoA:carnitine CoA-transferase CaiB-like acyl-CoA transferase